MRKILSLLLLVFILVTNSYAQVNRANAKKSVAYRSNYQRMSSGSIAFHTLEIRNGTLWAWGFNEAGQLGDGTGINRTSPVQIGTDNNWVTVATAYAHSLALKSNGTLWAWGDALWSGNNTNPSVPQQIGNDNTWISISCGDSHSMALKSDGTLWSWGWNSSGELGDGTFGDTNIPAQVGTDHDWTYINAFHESSFAIKSNGTLWSWGLNDNGQLGNGTNDNRNTPGQVGLENNWTIVSGGLYYALGIKSDGSLWSWGNINNSLTPVQTGSDNKWVSVSAGNQGLALKCDGTIYSLVSNNATQIGTDNNWVTISGNYSHSMASKADGSLWAWGSNDFGQLGNGTTISEPLPIQISVLKEWLSISAWDLHSAGIKTDGTLWAWGNNDNGQLGDGTTDNKNNPVQVGTGNNWISVSAGAYHTLGLKADGTLWAWGNNSFGQMGDGTNDDQLVPTQIGLDNKWTSIAAGSLHSLALKSDGTLWAWGWNEYGQIGDGGNTQQNSPVQIGLSNKWVSIEGGDNHSMALQADGTLWTWGWNSNGQLGNGGTTNVNIPTQIGTDNSWTAISGGNEHSLALRSNGTLWSWGWNQQGQLGNGTTLNHLTPEQSGSANTWINISSGGSHNIGIKSTGQLWGWGYNDNGQLGDGSNTQHNSPVLVGTDNNWVNIATGSSHSLGLRTGRNSVCGTGNNLFGQLGDNTYIGKTSFVCPAECLLPAAPTAGANQSVCSGSNATLTATGTGTLGWYDEAVDGLWLGGGSSFATPPITGTTTFYVQDSTCAASVTRTAVTVTLKSPLPPEMPYAPNQIICNGESATFVGYGSIEGTISWYDAPTGGNYLGSGYIFHTPPLHATNVITDYYYYLQDSVCSASGRATAWVQVYPSTVPTFDPIGPVCYGSVPPVLPATSTNFNIPGTWSPATVSNTQSATYTFYPGGHYLECNVPVSIYIEVVPVPTAAIINQSGTNILTCSLSSIQVVATGGESYEWNNGLGNEASATITSPGIYSVTVTGIGGCTSQASITITGSTAVLPPPVPYAPNQIICSGESAQFAAYSTADGTVSWYDAPTGGNYLGSGHTFTTPPLYSVSGITDYYFYLQDSLCTASARATAWVQVYAHTVPSFASIAPVCYGTVAPVLPTTSLNGVTGTWLPATTSSTTSGTYTFTPVGEYLECLVPATLDITVVPLPTAAIINQSGTTTLSCTTTSINVVATGGVSYEWNNGLGNQAAATITSPGIYSVTVTGIGGCTSQAFITITGSTAVLPAPVISGLTNVCRYIGTGEQVMFTVPVESIPTTYTWTVPPTVTIISGQGNDTLIVTIGAGFIANANKQIRVRGVSACGISDLYIHYLLAQAPGATSAISGPTEVCPFIGSATGAIYSINPVTSASAYSWTIPAGASISSDNGNSITVLYDNSFSTGTISVRALNNCGNGPVRSITVKRTGATMPGLISGPTNPCMFLPSDSYPSGLPATYSITKQANVTTYNWTVPTGATITNHSNTLTDDMITVSFSNTFIYGSISVTAANSCGTSAARSLALNKLFPGAVAHINGPTDACGYTGDNGLTAVYVADQATNANYYNWTIPTGSTGLTGQGTTTISFKFPSGFTTGTVKVTPSNGCANAGTRSLTVRKYLPAKPDPIAESIAQSSCPVRIYNYSIPGMPAYTQNIQWEVPVRATLLSGQGTTSISVAYDSTALTGIVSAIPHSDCGIGSARRMHVDIPACSPLFTRNNSDQQTNIHLTTVNVAQEKLSVSLFPNPTASSFNIKLNSKTGEPVKLNILDLRGRLLNTLIILPNEVNTIGNDLKPGMYIIEARQGTSLQSIKAVKL